MFFRAFFILFVLFSVSAGLAMKLHSELSLEGEWKFEIGDREEYANPKFDDDQWEKVIVPDSWENQGFPGYDGFAWYRKSFQLDKNLRSKRLYLQLGKIDDIDMVYLNGHYIGGKGQLPPNYKTAYDETRIYEIPPIALNFGGNNVLAVRVYDAQGVGGIYIGQVGIYSRIDIVDLAIDLSGHWKFKFGDNPDWKQPGTIDADWKEINTPAYWEDEGYPNLDGFAWYRRNVVISDKLARNKLILLLGKINDVDQVFFNGTLIGTTGYFDENNQPVKVENIKLLPRAYFIPPDLIRTGRNNVIAVRVFDAGHKGGIYEEYIGIVTRHEYLKYMKTIR